MAAGFVATAFSGPSSAHAASPEEGITLRRAVQPTLPRPDFDPTEGVVLRWSRDLEWTRLALADDLSLDSTIEGPSSQIGIRRDLQNFDLRQQLWASTPRAATTVASAVASLATRGITVFDETRDYQTIRRHRLGCYFRARGGGLVWRIEF